MIEFRIGGRTVHPGDFRDAIQAALLEQIREDLHSKIGSIRDPETGEFPTVVVNGRDIEHLSLKVEGSAKLVELVKNRLNLNDDEVAAMERNGKPVAFLCHASEDKETVRRLANDLMQNGIDVFFDEWEIRAGDSLRQRIDEGLERCTHFIAVLSPVSIKKPWVNAEMDAGFVQKLKGLATFIPLRLGIAPEALPLLLSGVSAPAIDNYEDDIPALISEIHGLSRKPPLGWV